MYAVLRISIQTEDVQEAITNATDSIQKPILHLSKQDTTDLLTVTLNNMYFSFQSQVFRQKEGLPMGSSISGILAILFMDKLETIALSSHLSISCYRRYVDDIYLQTTGEGMADQFHYTMNNLHPKLKFEIEKPETTPDGLSLSLLDFKVTVSKDGKSSFEFYKKSAKKPLFVHHKSAIPKKSKTNFRFVMSENVSRIDAPHRQQQQNTKMHSMTSSV